MKSPLLTTVTLLFAFSSPGVIQDNLAGLQSNGNPCDQYKMRVANPSENLDPKMVIKMDADVDPAMVINPCPATPRTATRINKEPESDTNQKQNAVTPSLKFTLPNKESKTPSEILKQFSVPTTPKPNR